MTVSRLATAVAVVAVAAAHIGVGDTLHAALRVVAVGTGEVGVGHRGRATLVAALHAAPHAPEAIVIETTGLVAGVGLARQLAERVVGITPVAQVGVAHVRLAAQKVVVWTLLVRCQRRSPPSRR